MIRAIDAGQIFRFIIRRWPLFMLTLIVSSALGYIYTSGSTADTYEAKAMLYCPGAIPSEINEGKKAITTNRGIINSDKVAGEAILNLSFNISSSSLRKSVRLSSKENSAVYNIIALSAYPERAVEAANAMADAFVREVSGESGTVAVYEYAAKAKKVIDGKSKQRNRRIIIPALSFAGAVSVTVLYIMVFGRARSVAEAALYDRSNIFGVIVKKNNKE